MVHCEPSYFPAVAQLYTQRLTALVQEVLLHRAGILKSLTKQVGPSDVVPCKAEKIGFLSALNK